MDWTVPTARGEWLYYLALLSGGDARLLVDRRCLFAHGESELNRSRLVGGSTRGHPQDHPHDHTHEAPPRQHAHRGAPVAQFPQDHFPDAAHVHEQQLLLRQQQLQLQAQQALLVQQQQQLRMLSQQQGKQVSPVGAPSSRPTAGYPAAPGAQASASSSVDDMLRGSGAFSQAGTSRELTLDLKPFDLRLVGLTEDEDTPLPLTSLEQQQPKQGLADQVR